MWLLCVLSVLFLAFPVNESSPTKRLRVRMERKRAMENNFPKDGDPWVNYSDWLQQNDLEDNQDGEFPKGLSTKFNLVVSCSDIDYWKMTLLKVGEANGGNEESHLEVDWEADLDDYLLFQREKSQADALALQCSRPGLERSSKITEMYNCVGGRPNVLARCYRCDQVAELRGLDALEKAKAHFLKCADIDENTVNLRLFMDDKNKVTKMVCLRCRSFNGDGNLGWEIKCDKCGAIIPSTVVEPAYALKKHKKSWCDPTGVKPYVYPQPQPPLPLVVCTEGVAPEKIYRCKTCNRHEKNMSVKLRCGHGFNHKFSPLYKKRMNNHDNCDEYITAGFKCKEELPKLWAKYRMDKRQTHVAKISPGLRHDKKQKQHVIRHTLTRSPPKWTRLTDSPSTTTTANRNNLTNVGSKREGGGTIPAQDSTQ